MFADIALNPGGVIAWLIAGLIGGWLTGVVMKGGGYGIIWDIILGLIGAFLGGWITGFFVQGDMGFWGTVVVAFIGGCILVAIVRAIAPARPVP
jgi:uncharacterized membrane protein YeaQ/YmgE (transglycosylase-associated protein family)